MDLKAAPPTLIMPKPSSDANQISHDKTVVKGLSNASKITVLKKDAKGNPIYPKGHPKHSVTTESVVTGAEELRKSMRDFLLGFELDSDESFKDYSSRVDEFMAQSDEESYKAWSVGTPEEVVQEAPEAPEPETTTTENPQQININIYTS